MDSLFGEEVGVEVEGKVVGGQVLGCRGRGGGGDTLVEVGNPSLGELCNVPHRCVEQYFHTPL